MRKEEYIQEVISKIENKKARREVEKELSAHIDDRISYYTDAGWDEQTANEKAMSHMGKVEEVAEKMGKLHDENYSAAFIVLITVIAITAIVTVITLATGYYTVSWSWYEADTYSTLYLIAATCALNLLVFFLARKAHKHDSFSYPFLLAIQISRIVLLLIAPGIDYYIYDENEFVLVVLNVITLALVIVCCHWRDKESKGISSHLVMAVSSVFISVVVDVILIFSFAILPYNVISGIATKTINKKVTEKFLDRKPKEWATEEEQKQYDLSKYSDSSASIRTEKGDVDNWYINRDRVNPVKILCEKSSDGFEDSLYYVYWITDCDGILMRSRPVDLHVASEDYYISDDYEYPNADTDEIKSLVVYDVDITNEFDADFLKNTLSAVRYWDPVNIVEKDAVKSYRLSWTFKSKDCVFLYKAFLLEDKDGNFCFAPWIRKKPNENRYECFGEPISVDEATSANLHELLKDVPSSEEWYSYPESVWADLDYDE